MDEPHLLAAFRHVAPNLAKGRLVPAAEAWQWSSTPAHLADQDDGWGQVHPLLHRVGDAAPFLSVSPGVQIGNTHDSEVKAWLGH